jgi:DAACS family dicarboxylate/amino acid:cation (Na+ or H+) symporter/aerobic C4-dicarboxylate transport protein
MHKIPVSGLVLLLGVDRFLNEARAVTNLIGNGVATIVVARWEGALDMNRARAVLNRESAGGTDASKAADQEARERPVAAKEPLIRSGMH